MRSQASRRRIVPKCNVGTRNEGNENPRRKGAPRVSVNLSAKVVGPWTAAAYSSPVLVPVFVEPLCEPPWVVVFPELDWLVEWFFFFFDFFVWLVPCEVVDPCVVVVSGLTPSPLLLEPVATPLPGPELSRACLPAVAAMPVPFCCSEFVPVPCWANAELASERHPAATALSVNKRLTFMSYPSFPSHCPASADWVTSPGLPSKGGLKS